MNMSQLTFNIHNNYDLLYRHACYTCSYIFFACWSFEELSIIIKLYVLHIGKWDRMNGISQSIDIDTMYGSYYQSSVINPETHNIYTDY